MKLKIAATLIIFFLGFVIYYQDRTHRDLTEQLYLVGDDLQFENEYMKSHLEAYDQSLHQYMHLLHQEYYMHDPMAKRTEELGELIRHHWHSDKSRYWHKN